MSKIPVMEIFGPTIQGEGMVIGQKTMFVRTAGCDYSCSWCDSAFTWDGTGKNLLQQMTAEEIWAELKSLGGEGFAHVTISGGNPALIKNLRALIKIFKEHQVKVALETQGSKWQDWFEDIDDLTISPKPPSSGMVTDFNRLSDIIARVSQHKISIKVVVFNDEDYEYAKKVHHLFPDVLFYLQVGNENITTVNNETLISELLDRYNWLIDKAMADSQMKNVRVLPQLHTYVWGNKRGV